MGNKAKTIETPNLHITDTYLKPFSSVTAAGNWARKDLSRFGGPFSVVIRFDGKRSWCPYFGQAFKVVGNGLESVRG